MYCTQLYSLAVAYVRRSAHAKTPNPLPLSAFSALGHIPPPPCGRILWTTSINNITQHVKFKQPNNFNALCGPRDSKTLCDLELIAAGVPGVQGGVSGPPRRNDHFSSEFFLDRADLIQLHESHVNKHLSSLWLSCNTTAGTRANNG